MLSLKPLTFILVIGSSILFCRCQSHVSLSYIGCYNDPAFNYTRDLYESTYTDANLTIDKCVEFCFKNNFLYAGVQSGYQCFCGDQMGQYGKASGTNCSYPCSGNKNQTCGGFFKNSIYKSGTIKDIRKYVALLNNTSVVI